MAKASSSSTIFTIYPTVSATPCKSIVTNGSTSPQERSPPSAMASGAGRNRNGASLNCVPLVCCAVLLCWVGCHTPPPVTAHPRDHRPTVQRTVEDTEIGQLLSSLLDGAGRDGDDYNLEEDGEPTGGGAAGSAGSGNGSSLAGGHIDRVHKRSLSNLEIQPIIDDTNYTVYHVGVLMASHLGESERMVGWPADWADCCNDIFHSISCFATISTHRLTFRPGTLWTGYRFGARAGQPKSHESAQRTAQQGAAKVSVK